MRIPKAFTPDGFGVLLEAAIRLSFASGTAFAIVVGQFVLAAVLAAVTIGMFLRFWRLRRRAKRTL